MKKDEISKILAGLETRPSGKKSQNFLLNEEIARNQVEAADIQPGERVLEIGPGLGILSRYILEKTDNAFFIELDERLARYLVEKTGAEIIQGDALRIDWPPCDIVISNLPYHISSEITARILESQFKRAVLMFQKEFAAHLVAQPGEKKFSRISILREYYAEAEIIQHVSKSQFHPVPKVDSAIILLRSREPPIKPRDRDRFFRVVRMLFSHKKRTVRNALISEASKMGLAKPVLRERLHGLPHRGERVFKLGLKELNEIYEHLEKLKLGN